MKFGQILACSMANVSIMVLAECWRLKLTPDPFMIFLKLQDSKIYSGNLPFLIVPDSLFQKNGTLESAHKLLGLLRNWSRLRN